MVLLLDNYDSFTYILRDYIEQSGKSCLVVRNDAKDLESIINLDFDSIVISPGPKTPKDAGITMQVIEYFAEKKPILGICLGHQAIGEFFGAELIQAARPMHGKTSTINHRNHFLFENIADRFDVMRYHSLVLDNVHLTPLQVIAQTDEKEVMAVAHKSLPVAGVQFHPESVLTQNGLQLIENWFRHLVA